MITYIKRMKDEKEELNERLESLFEFIYGDYSDFKKLSIEEQLLMKRQVNHMFDYSCVLGERISRAIRKEEDGQTNRN